MEIKFILFVLFSTCFNKFSIEGFDGLAKILGPNYTKYISEKFNIKIPT